MTSTVFMGLTPPLILLPGLPWDSILGRVYGMNRCGGGAMLDLALAVRIFLLVATGTTGDETRFPLPWWERIKVRGNALTPALSQREREQRQRSPSPSGRGGQGVRAWEREPFSWQ
jgi:hypothetical protein